MNERDPGRDPAEAATEAASEDGGLTLQELRALTVGDLIDEMARQARGDDEAIVLEAGDGMSKLGVVFTWGPAGDKYLEAVKARMRREGLRLQREEREAAKKAAKAGRLN